ncbi:unnamed protein product, partial [Mesorhabditis belari]|uniref:LCR n=1 Tax=Mesorhabditis belari TaxID=2138241 RepID=A0AAF3F814_9BILA
MRPFSVCLLLAFIFGLTFTMSFVAPGGAVPFCTFTPICNTFCPDVTECCQTLGFPSGACSGGLACCT